MATSKLGIFGGTFDPTHVGHLILAAEARDQLGLDRVIWVLTPDPPHKRLEDISQLEHRLVMVQMAIAGDPQFELSRVDIERPGPHLAVDTVNILRKQYPDADLYYLMGGDSLESLPQWYTPDAFLHILTGIGVMRRPGDEINLDSLIENLPELPEKLHFITAPLLEISAQQIRRRVRSHRAFRYYLTPEIYKYICAKKLYLA